MGHPEQSGRSPRVAAQAGANRAVLVGHSQGSVLCAWWVCHRSPNSVVGIDLVTCGSPLESLYAKFFPRHIGAEFLGWTAERARTWRNFWRDIDPIATQLPIGSPNSGDTYLPDPDNRERVQAHGNYWIDKHQSDWIEGRMSATP